MERLEADALAEAHGMEVVWHPSRPGYERAAWATVWDGNRAVLIDRERVDRREDYGDAEDRLAARVMEAIRRDILGER